MRRHVLKMWHHSRAMSRTVVVIALVLAACGGTKELVSPPPPPPPPPVVPASVTIADRTDTLQQLVAVTLSATIRGTNGLVLSTPAVRWSSLNARIATIDSTGVLIPRKPGVANIVATVGSLADTTQVRVGMRWLSIVGSSYGHCGIGGDSTAYCWGINTERNSPTPPPSRPTEVPGNLHFASLTMGFYFACGITSTGVAYCWGTNDRGQFAATTPAVSATPVALSLPAPLARLSAGTSHVCGLSTQGDVYCWGDNTTGQLGDARATGAPFDPSPRKIAGLPRIKSIAAGIYHQCALSDAGQAYCWGDNRYGHVGGGTISMVAAVTPVTGNLVFRDIGARYDGSCGVAVSGGVYCWGNSSLPADAAVPRLEPETLAYTEMAGSGYVRCGISPSGMFCRGNNSFYTLGIPNLTSAATLLPVLGGGDFVKMALSAASSCAINKVGKAFCWGDNLEGSVGDGTRGNERKIPTAVVDPEAQP